MDERFSGIREFLAAAEAGSFTAAADRLNLTGSAVGKSIARLEQRLNTQLFHRTTRKITLTAEGELYRQSCLRVMEELTQAEALLSREQSQPIGTVRIDMPTVFGRECLLPKLMPLVKRYPKLHLHLSFQDRKVDMIGEQVDIAVRFGELDDLSDIIAQPIGETQNLLCASPEFLRGNGCPTSPADLCQFPCISGSGKAWRLYNAEKIPTDYPIALQHQSNDGDATLKLALNHLGIAYLPNWLIAPYLQTGQLIVVLPETALPPVPIYVLWQKKMNLQPKIKAVVEGLRESMGEDIQADWE